MCISLGYKKTLCVVIIVSIICIFFLDFDRFGLYVHPTPYHNSGIAMPNVGFEHYPHTVRLPRVNNHVLRVVLQYYNANLHKVYITRLCRRMQYRKKTTYMLSKAVQKPVADEDEGEVEYDSVGKNIKRTNNHIYFYSEVTRETIFDLIMHIKDAEEENLITSIKLHIDSIPIFLHINSNGGSVFDAFNAIDVIQACRMPVHTIVEGATASAGTLMSVVGKKKYMTKNAFMLIHQLSSVCWGKMSEIEDEFENLQELTEKIKEIYSENTKIPKKELNKLLQHDLWLNSSKSLKYGLVDELWTG